MHASENHLKTFLTGELSQMSKTILTVDDSRTMRDMLMLALSDAGFRVVQAEDGMHGLEVLQNEEPDVIVTDINMPRMDGFGFIEGVRRDAKHRAVPILVLTTESDAEKKDRARRAGATGWIIKPFDPLKLVAAIRRVAA
jgi:two-component system, chemotaxis family, chemotaxis protein CheY